MRRRRMAVGLWGSIARNDSGAGHRQTTSVWFDLDSDTEMESPPPCCDATETELRSWRALLCSRMRVFCCPLWPRCGTLIHMLLCFLSESVTETQRGEMWALMFVRRSSGDHHVRLEWRSVLKLCCVIPRGVCMPDWMQVSFEWNLCGGMVIVSDGGNDNVSSFKVGDCILVSDYATFEWVTDSCCQISYDVSLD